MDLFNLKKRKMKNEYNNPNNIVYEDTEELKNTINDDYI